MLDLVLGHIREKLNEYLASSYEFPGEIVVLGMPDEEEEEGTDQLMIGLLNLERETAAGITAGNRRSGRTVIRHFPALQMNLYFVLSAVFEGKKYTNGIKMLSDALGFFQQEVRFETATGIKFTVEPVTVSMQELSNIWSILGGRYYPSMIYKLRMLTIDGEEMSGTTVQIRKTE